MTAKPKKTNAPAEILPPARKPNAKIPISLEVVDQICKQLETSCDGIVVVLDRMRETDRTIPSLRTFYDWLGESEDVLKIYTRARQLQADFLVDEAVKVARTPLIGITSRTVTKNTGKTEHIVIEGDNVERSKLIVYTLMKRAAQLNPKKYGEHLIHSGDAGDPIKLVVEHIAGKRLEDSNGEE